MTSHPSIPAAPAADSEITDRMAEIRALLNIGEMHQLLDVELVTLAGDETPHEAYQRLYREAPRHLVYLFDGLISMQAQRDAARAELAEVVRRVAFLEAATAGALDQATQAQAMARTVGDQRDAARASLAEERRVTALQARQYQGAREEAQAAHREALRVHIELERAEAEAGRLREALSNLIDEHEQSDEPQYYAVHVSDFDAAVRALKFRSAAENGARPDPVYHSARATLARLPVINDPVISEAVRSLEEDEL